MVEILSLSNGGDSDSMNKMRKQKEKHIWRKMTFYFLHVEFKIVPEHEGGSIKQIQNVTFGTLKKAKSVIENQKLSTIQAIIKAMAVNEIIGREYRKIEY